MTFFKKLRKSTSFFSTGSRLRTTGAHIRHFIDRVSTKMAPYVTKVIPNFRAAHYAYIIFMVFFTSVIVYPISDKKFKYIDILFLMGGASTQAGLNTLNMNQLHLLQQILVYITTTLTTPIFIHSSLLLVRLYWFERYFDNIKETSKLNFRMRRNATLAARTKSIDSTVMNTVNNQGLGLDTSNKLKPSGQGIQIHEKHPDIDTSSNVDPVDCGNGNEHALTGETTKASSSQEKPGSPSSLTGPTSSEAIKFGELPHPRRRQEIEPSDMYKSIHMLQHERKNSVADDDVLVIRAPNEIERDSHVPIYTTKVKRSSSASRKKWRFGDKSKQKWQNLKRTISNNSALRQKRSSVGLESFQLHDGEDDTRNDGDDEKERENENDDKYENGNENGDEDENSEEENDEDAGFPWNGKLKTNRNHEASDGDMDENSIFSDDDVAVEDSEDDEHEKGGTSFVDPPPDSSRKTKFALDPSIDRQKYPSRPSARQRLRKWRTPIISRLGSHTMSEGKSDDEEDGFSDASAGVMSTNYLSWTPTIGRNSTFVDMTDEQKEELGGVEYRAIKLLIKILAVFYCGFHIIALCLYVGFIYVADSYKQNIISIGVSPVWWGIFTAQSVFNDLGLTLTPDSMMSFSRSVYILVFSSFFIVIGNTGFPVILRFIIWIMFKFARPLSLYKESLGFLLDHPRRCFTLLFPSVPTWWLFFILVALNLTDLILFLVLDLKNSYLQAIPTGYRILDGLFQAFSTRTAGFSVVNLAELHVAVQVSYMIMMYISVLPLAISIRRTNVYEEQSLGVYVQHGGPDNVQEDNPTSFVGAHLRNQLSFDLWFIFLGLFIICIAEGLKVNSNLSFTVFSIMFEIISAYGTVGLSLGYPGVDESLSYEFSTVSKLVIIAMMIRGRHRGLPYALDRAIMVPNDDMLRRDKYQENHAVARGNSLDAASTRNSNFDVGSGNGGITERLGELRRTITRRASTYRRNSLFPVPTRLPDDPQFTRHPTHTRLNSN